MPVYSAHSGDPCYSSSGFTSSVCTMAYRWNLDAKDTHGKAMAYYFHQSTNYYGEDIGTEHIPLCLIRESDGVAAAALGALGITLEAARSHVERRAGTGAAVPKLGQPPFTPRARKVLELSLRESMRLGHDYMSTEHMLLGLIRQGEGLGVDVLTLLGTDLGKLRRQVIVELIASWQARDGAGAAGDTAFRNRVNALKLESGDAALASEVVQDVEGRRRQGRLKVGERRMLARARRASAMKPLGGRR